MYWDGQVEDDARLVIAVARTAAAHGARILTYCMVTELHEHGVCVCDERSGETFEVRAHHVVNATSVWPATSSRWPGWSRAGART